mmetsp:Transcript_3491/g.4095  ORF Transcript_3491/g.4095 Transcript_3491/m.4095 type:complete len:339 (+) Transcript_3491:112-1128(+)
MVVSRSRKPWIFAFFVCAHWLCVTRDATSLVAGTPSRITRKCPALFAELSESWGFDLQPVLEAARNVWGRLYEEYTVQQAGSKYRPVLGNAFAVDMGGRGQVDFLGVGRGHEAWQAFAQDYRTYMHNTTLDRLQGPHFLIAEIGLTTKALRQKFQKEARSLSLMQEFIANIQASNLSAVKCLVYDGADAEDFTNSTEASKFLAEGGVLVNIPYLSAETVLAKLNEQSTQLATLMELVNRSGTTVVANAISTCAVWVRQLNKDDEKFEQIGSAFRVKGELAIVDDLKEAIKKKEELTIAASKIDIYSQKDGTWIQEELMSASLRDTDESDCYGFTVPSA